MSTHDQLELERAVSPARPKMSISGIKTILLHVQNDKSLETRLETALSLARACGAHLTCLHVTPIQAYVAFDSFGGVFVMNDVIQALDEEEQALQKKLEAELSKEDVSWDYIQVTGDVVGQLVSHASLADLVVTSREPHRADFAGPALRIMGDLLYRSRTPLFIPGDGDSLCDPAGPAVIAWNGSYEAANAVRASIGLLKLASEVKVIAVEHPKVHEYDRSRLLEYLSRHGIHAEINYVSVPEADDEMIGPRILGEAIKLKAGYIVMGGYGHNRIAEYVFGGVTRTFLSSSPVPLLMAH